MNNLVFTSHGQAVSLKPGEAWTPVANAETYRDTSAQELWEIVQAIRNGQPWRDVVGSRYAKTNPWLHDIVTSPRRDLFFRQNPPKSSSRILDIGSGWGQIALPLARDAKAHVVALEPTPERLAFIQAVAQQEGIAERMNFLQADFFDVEFGVADPVSGKHDPAKPARTQGAALRGELESLSPATPNPSPSFDLISCIGVLEWVAKFRGGDPREVQIDFLRRARRLLAPGGELVVGIENRLGLKYLLGAPDDHIGIANIGCYNAELASKKWLKHSGRPLRSFTFTRAELDELLRAAGFTKTTFFAALPDYKLPEKILPLGTETNNHFASDNFIPEHDGTNGRPLAFQEELESHYRSLAALGIVSDFVPSFFVQAS